MFCAFFACTSLCCNVLVSSLYVQHIRRACFLRGHAFMLSLVVEELNARGAQQGAYAHVRPLLSVPARNQLVATVGCCGARQVVWLCAWHR